MSTWWQQWSGSLQRAGRRIGPLGWACGATAIAALRQAAEKFWGEPVGAEPGKAFDGSGAATPKHESLGYRGELAAADYLRQQGYQIVCHGFQTADGELDLVAVDGQVVVYVEVKTLQRAGSRPEAAVHYHKRRQLIRLARVFAASRGLLHHSSRFDVVAVVWPDPAQPPLIRHHRHAFRGDDDTRGGYHRDH
jgi:putative endonuclease